jgi:hypothetical protein
MGQSKLSIWFRDEQCKPFPNLVNLPNYDWVNVWDCSGNLIVHAPVPISKHAHVDIEIPPGCYIVQGHVCGERVKPAINIETSKAIVMVGCDEVRCVNLIVPWANTCAREFVQPLVENALIQNVPIADIQIALRTIMRAVGIQRDELIYEIDKNIERYSAIKEAVDVQERYEKTKEILLAVVPISLP